MVDPGAQIFGSDEGEAISLERGWTARIGCLRVDFGRVTDMTYAAEAV